MTPYTSRAGEQHFEAFSAPRESATTTRSRLELQHWLGLICANSDLKPQIPAVPPLTLEFGCISDGGSPTSTKPTEVGAAS